MTLWNVPLGREGQLRSTPSRRNWEIGRPHRLPCCDGRAALQAQLLRATRSHAGRVTLGLASGHFSTQTVRRDSPCSGITPTGNREAGKFATDTTQLPTGCQPESLVDRMLGRAGAAVHLAARKQLRLGCRASTSRALRCKPSLEATRTMALTACASCEGSIGWPSARAACSNAAR